MEHHAPIIEEAEKEVYFQTIAIAINTIEVLIHFLSWNDMSNLSAMYDKMSLSVATPF